MTTKPTTAPPLMIANIAGTSRRLAPMRELSLSPPFSLWPLLFVIVAKPAADAFYHVNWVKYAYMAMLLLATLFARYGQSLSRTRVVPARVGAIFILWIFIYFYFLFGSALALGGSLQEIFKIVSPFVFFAMVYFAADRRMAPALAVGAGLVIVANAALLPTDFGWRIWGGINTFKGFYYFKTDLAYSLSFSILILAIYYRFTHHPVLIALIGLAAVQIVFANSRLNYLMFGLILLFLAFKGGMTLRSMLRLGLLALVVAAVFAYTYNSSKLLGFNFENLGALTQGRNRIWASIINAMSDFSIADWLFGRGMYADLLLSAEEFSIYMAHDAHNEFLHLWYTQGAVGTLLYTVLWVLMFRIAYADPIPARLRFSGAAAAGLFVLQGMTAVVSSFATKTWPFVLVLLMVRAAAQRKDDVVGPAALP